MKKPGAYLWAAALAVYAFLYLPLAIVVIFSFNDSMLNAEWVGFTWRWYGTLIHDGEMLQAAGNSLLIALLSSASATVLGASAGIAMHRYRFRWLPLLVLTPVAMPEILLGVSLLLFFRQVLDLTLGFLSILVAHITFSIGFVAVIVRARLAGMDESLFEAARDLGADALATGHYARLRHNPDSGLFELLKGLDPSKDQSYFLHRLNQAQLSKTLFPVGELHKTEVRRIADDIGLPNAKKKDSTGICFIGERPFREFLNRYIANEPGPIKDERGRKIGNHVGLSFYTLGQRQGLGIGGLKEKGAQRGGGEHQPWFVARKDMAANTLWVVQGHDHPWLLSPTLTADDTSWVAGHPPAQATLAAKTRYRQTDAPCHFEGHADGSFTLDFPQDQWAVTPGQSAVLYDGEVCLGGGVIAQAGPGRATSAATSTLLPPAPRVSSVQ